MVHTLLSSRWAAAAMAGASALLVADQALALDHPAANVAVVRPGGDRPCTLLTLVGIDQADPAYPGSAWFSFPDSAPGYKEMVATLLVAKASNRLVRVTTSGSVPAACGHPGITTLLLD